jgi:hypothetical protein
MVSFWKEIQPKTFIGLSLQEAMFDLSLYGNHLGETRLHKQTDVWLLHTSNLKKKSVYKRHVGTHQTCTQSSLTLKHLTRRGIKACISM